MLRAVYTQDIAVYTRICLWELSLWNCTSVGFRSTSSERSVPCYKVCTLLRL